MKRTLAIFILHSFSDFLDQVIIGILQIRKSEINEPYKIGRPHTKRECVSNTRVYWSPETPHSHFSV